MVYNLCILIINMGSCFLSIKLASTSIKLASTSISYQFNTPDQPIQNHKFNTMKFEYKCSCTLGACVESKICSPCICTQVHSEHIFDSTQAPVVHARPLLQPTLTLVARLNHSNLLFFENFRLSVCYLDQNFRLIRYYSICTIYIYIYIGG